MILRLVLCFCFVHCGSWGIGNDDNTVQLKTNNTNAENLGRITTESRLDGDKLPEEDNPTKIRSPSEKHELDERESVERTERKLPSHDDLTRTNNSSGDTSFEMPAILIKGEPQRVFESNKGECISELSVKKIVKDVLKYVKKHPEALDLMINDNESENEGEAQLFNTRSDQIDKELRSLRKPLFEYSLFNNNNGCPLAIVRYLKQIPKFLLQLRKYPECLLAVFGCNQQFEIQSTSSGFCEILLHILYVNKIPRPDSRPAHEFILPTPEVSDEVPESMEPNGQIPFHLEESNESQSESNMKQYLIVPKYFPQEEMPADVIEPFKHQPSHVPVNIQAINDTYIEPTYIEDTESSNEYKDIIIQVPETTYNSEEKVEDTYLDDVKEKLKHIYVEHPELINDEEFKPGDEFTVIHKHTPIYVEKLSDIDDHKPLPIHVKEPKPIAIQEPEPIYIDDERPINKHIHIEEPKPAYHQYPVYVDESTLIHGTDNSPTYVENIYPDINQEKPKPIYAESSELPYTEQLKPGTKPIVIDKPAPMYVEKLNPILVDESKQQKPLPILIKEPISIAIHEPKPIYSEESRPHTKPIYIEEHKPVYHLHSVYFDEATPFFGTEYNPKYVKDIYSKEVKDKSKPIYVEHPELSYDEKLKPGIEPTENDKPIYVEKVPLNYVKELRPNTESIYLNESKTNNVKKVVPFGKPDPIKNSEPTYVNNMQNPLLEIQPEYIDYSIPTHEKEHTNEGLRPIDIEKPESIYIHKLKPIFIDKPERLLINDNPDYFYIEKPEYIYTDEIKPEPTYVDKETDYIEYPEVSTFTPELISKPQPIYVEETSPVLKLNRTPVIEQPQFVPDYVDQLNTYFEKPQQNDYPDQETIYPEAPELLYPDQSSNVKDSKPIYVQAPEMTFIKNPNNIDQIQPIHMPQTPKEQPGQQVYIQILPSSTVQQITQLINNNPEKHIKDIKEVLQKNQHVVKPRLYKILFSVLNALIKGIIDSERFSEIVNYLIQPRIKSEWNNKKTQTLYYLLSPGKTGQVEASTLDIIYGLIHQPENTSNNPQMLDLMFPLLLKIKTDHVDHRINDIILALLNRNKNNIFSDKEVQILLTFIKPNKMGYIPKQRVDIAAMLVNFDKIPYFSQSNIKTMFLLMSKNKTGRIDPRAIQILSEILQPKKFSFLSEQNIIDLLGFLGTDNGEFIHPKRLDITLFLLKSKPQAPILIDYFINNLNEREIIHSKFIDIILYLNKNKMLTYDVLETLVSLLSQEKSGRIDSTTYNSFLLLLEPYKSSRPKVVLHVYHILNRETFPTSNLDISTHPHKIPVLMYHLMNSGTKHFDQSLNKGYTQPELKKFLSKVLESESVQNNELVPQLLKHNSGYVDLTYLLNEEEPILYNPIYYVKYNIPVKDFLKKIQNIIASNPELSNDPPKLLRELTRAGSVSGVSPNLNVFQKEEILKLAFEDGKLIQAKILNEKKLNLNDQIKRIQDFNSNTSPQEILKQNEINAAKYYTTYKGIPSNLAGIDSVVHGGNIGSLDGLGHIVMSLKKNNLREFKTIGKPTYNSTQTSLTNVEDVNAKNETELQQNNEN